jgi:hypothetical protein
VAQVVDLDDPDLVAIAVSSGANPRLSAADQNCTPAFLTLIPSLKRPPGSVIKKSPGIRQKMKRRVPGFT